jgi:cystathionine beta-lyase/cystathionine gamma-synthase
MNSDDQHRPVAGRSAPQASRRTTPSRQTAAVHFDTPPLNRTEPLGVAIHRGQVFGFSDAETMAESLAAPGEPFVYGRYGNPTVQALERAVADLEGGAAAWAAASGMGAITTTLWSLLSTGDHVVTQSCLYGGTSTVLNDLARRWGVELTVLEKDTPEELAAALRPETRLVVLETIANPTGAVADLPALAAQARAAGVLTVVDNTFATPLLCRPIEHGADIVVHSATKYIGGHADVLGGIAVFAEQAVHDSVWGRAVEYGAVLDPTAAWLLLRGLQTLGVRMQRHCANAQTLAERLAAHPAVTAVHYPGLADHPHHAGAAALLDGGFGGVLSFELLGGREAGRAFIEAVRLATLAPSLGDVKTLVMHPASVSHRKLSAEQLAQAGISEGLVRLSTGIEDAEDLWADIEKALAAAV